MAARGELSVGVLEDNDDDYFILARVLEGQATVRRWTTAEEALETLGLHREEITALSVLFVDLSLPGHGGLKVLEQLRSMPAPKPRTVVLSGSEDPRIYASALELGADGFERKPSTVAELQALVDRVLRPLR